MKARCAAKAMTHQYQDHWNMLENAIEAAKALANNLDWNGLWYVGVVHGGEHVFVNDKLGFTLGGRSVEYLETILSAAQAYADVMQGDDEQESKARAQTIYDALDRFAKL